MAISRNNPLTKGASRMFGDIVVFRTWNGKTYMSKRPKKPTKQSPLQKENRTKFQRATLFAKKMMADQSTKEEYWVKAKQLNLPNAYTAAITEYMRKPEINDLDTTGYSGMSNQEIKINVTKKGFNVGDVEIVIVGKDGKIIEEGKAVKNLTNNYIYTTFWSIGNKDSVEIIINVRERTGLFYSKRSLILF